MKLSFLTFLAVAHAVKRFVTSIHDRCMQRLVGSRFFSQVMVTTRSTAKQQQQTAESLAHVVARLREVQQEQHTPVSNKLAAVLVALFEDEQGVVRVWLTRRAAHLNSHQGEVCLPGGKRDETDPDDAFTATREAHEEMGLPPGSAQVLCQLPPMLSKHLLSVTPVVARVPASFVPVANASEVDAVFSMPLAAFLSAHQHMHWDMRSKSSKRYYRVHSFDYQNFIVWGLTAAILIRVAALALGRPPDFEEHHPSSRM